MPLPRAPGFGPLLAGQAVNAIGNWVAVLAIWGFAAFEFDAGPGDLALLFAVLSVPGALLGPVLGVPIDRLGPRRTLVLANALGFLDALALTQADSYGDIILLALPLGLIEALADASLDALPPRMFPDDQLVSANAFLGGAQDLAIVVGPVVAAVVNAKWGLTGAFAADAATFLVGLAVALPLTAGPVPADPGGPGTTWAALGDGMRLARRVGGVRWTLAVAATTYAVWALFGVLEPLYVRDVLGRSDTVFAMMQAVFGAGLVGGGLAVAALGDRVSTPRHVALATIASGATAALYLGTLSLPIAFVGSFLWGVDIAFFYVPAKTLLQRYAPTSAHGRILSINQSLEPLVTLAVAPVAAVALGVAGVRVLGLAGGAAAAVAGVIALGLARRLGPPPPPVPLDPLAAGSADPVALGGPAPTG